MLFLVDRESCIKPIMISRIETGNQQQISSQIYGKELEEFDEDLSKVKCGDKSAVQIVLNIDRRHAILFLKMQHDPNVSKKKQQYIEKLKLWIEYQIQHQIGQSSKSRLQMLQFSMKVLERVVYYSQFARFIFLPKQVQRYIQQLKEKIQEIMIDCLAEVKDCIFPKQNNNKLKKNANILKNIFAHLKLLKPKTFLNNKFLEGFEDYFLSKKKILRQDLKLFQDKYQSVKPESLQKIYVNWQQAKLLDFIQSNNDRLVFPQYVQYLSKHLKQEMQVLRECSKKISKFCQVLYRNIIKFKDFIDLDLEQQFLKPINHFKDVQQEQILKLCYNFQRRHKKFKDLIDFRQRIASFLSVNIDNLTTKIVKKNFYGILLALKQQKRPQVLMKYKNFCKETYDQFGEKYDNIKQLRQKVLAMIQKRQEMLQKMDAIKNKRKDVIRERHHIKEPNLNLQELKCQQQINFFVEKAVLSIYRADGKIFNMHIENSQVIIKQTDYKFLAQENNPFQSREVIIIEDDDQ